MIPPPPGWLKNAMQQAGKPKESVIAVLKKNLGGLREKRDRKQVHASDITKEDFCPRQWALYDLRQEKTEQEYISAALQATFDLGSMTAQLLIEKWAGDAVIGNWVCQRCQQQRTMTSKPKGICPLAKGKDLSHLWRYVEFTVESPEHEVTGSIDAIFFLGTSYLRVVELKILAPAEFDKLAAPYSEHRIRTSLYLQLIALSKSIYQSRFNLHAATVLYVSRGYGKKNPDCKTSYGKEEILPFKEFEVQRDDSLTKEPLQKAKALKIFRTEGKMPTGICGTVFDKFAKKCSVCQDCFSGNHPHQVNWEDL